MCSNFEYGLIRFVKTPNILAFQQNSVKTKAPGFTPRALNWLRGRDLNPRPPGYEPDELPTALSRVIIFIFREVVPETGLEPVRESLLIGF